MAHIIVIYKLKIFYENDLIIFFELNSKTCAALHIWRYHFLCSKNKGLCNGLKWQLLNRTCRFWGI